MSTEDAVDRNIAHTNQITRTEGKLFEDLNIKLVPRVFLDWDGKVGAENDPKQHWPADLHTFDYDSPTLDDSLHYAVPDQLRAVQMPKALTSNAVVPWTFSPEVGHT